MEEKKNTISDALREKAESLLKQLPEEKSRDTHSDIMKVLHELHVHQIELELQNEELQRAHNALEKSRSNYMRLYHDAPVGYIVLDQSGITRKVNQTFAQMLGAEPETISGTPFADFLVGEDRAIFRARLKAFYRNPIDKQIDVRLARSGTPFHVSLRAIINEDLPPSISGSSNELLVTVTDISERHRYQTALEEKTKELEDILSSISDGFISLDTQLKIHYFNNAAEQLLRIKRHEVLDRYLFDAFPFARGSEFETWFQKALHSGEVQHFETHFDQTPHNEWFEVSAYPYGDGLSVFFRIITERKLAENALRQSEERFRSYIEHSPYGVFVTTSEGDFQKVNPAFCTMTGLSVDELRGLNINKIFLPELFPENVSRPKQFQREVRYINCDGKIGWASLSTVKIDQNKFLSFVEEISERKNIQRELLESQRALSLYNKIATTFLVSRDEDLFHNVLDLLLDSFSCEFGYVGYINDAGDLVCPTMTRDIWEKCSLDNKDIVFRKKDWAGLWGQSLLEERPLVANENLAAPTGHIALHNALAVPVMHHSRVIGQFVLANKEDGFSEADLNLLESTAKQTAPILQSLLDRIQQEKLQKRLDIVNRQLDKVESLNRMAAAIAHNYNNLLTIIMGGIELAIEDLPEHYHDTRRHLKDALQASRHGANIGGMLLTYLGHAMKDEKPLDLGRLTSESIANFSHEKRWEVEIHTHLPEESVIVSADSQLIEKMLYNFLINSAEAMENGGGTISVKVDSAVPAEIETQNRFPVEWQAQVDHYARLTIRDDGCGIDQVNIKKLFDPFYSEKFTGRGMGLATVLGVVKIYKGAITVESTRNQGSTFRIYLPLLHQEDT
ncbi:MAG: PAS domain S-box protein [Desulfopila sp.]|jgi:PAS domain S-box-containing protein|nr:PAS domain S-box protein [Desulfopila sp.]